ncbi:MAG TPA: YdeI/OmpD-associated family protein [Bryobacteraceae bacterium]|jgi:uncharacterized protein YdeI (YjbR/CyaY-like superfamily)|nr:YdeI/OmpD-associated family protein [Bryobacteraceae bacterium]
MKDALPVLAFPTLEVWEEWLAHQKSSSAGVWLKFARKGSGLPSVSKQDAIDGALCYGWIDGQIQPFDQHHWLVRFTPRGTRSKWSQINRERAQQLIELGRMQPAGAAEIARAQQDGRWESAYAPQSRIDVPDDLDLALTAHPQAGQLFRELDSANRYAILYRIAQAKKPETRAARIAKIVEMLERGETFHPRRQAKKRSS